MGTRLLQDKLQKSTVNCLVSTPQHYNELLTDLLSSPFPHSLILYQKQALLQFFSSVLFLMPGISNLCQVPPSVPPSFPLITASYTVLQAPRATLFMVSQPLPVQKPHLGYFPLPPYLFR